MRQKTNPFISVVLPVYNESAGIGETLTELANYVRARPERYELILSMMAQPMTVPPRLRPRWLKTQPFAS